VSSPPIVQLQAEVDYYRDRVALLRARRYRWGLGNSTRLQGFERRLKRAEQRLHDARLPDKP
jgi:hypothetical protein